MDDRVARDRQMLVDAKQRGRSATFGAFVKLSGPGWLQSAITLGGGSLAGSLYLGVLVGYSMLWLQPLAMIMGVIMLSAISYVTLVTGQRPFKAINTYVNPVLGWGWALAAMMANLVWIMPQFALGTAAVQQNLLGGSLGAESAVGDTGGKIIIVAVLFAIATVVIWFYNSGGRGIKIFETVLKIMVGIVVISFFGVVVTLASQLPWGQIGSGFIPDLRLLFAPAESMQPLILNVDEQFREFWTNHVVREQRNVMITAAATAVGINMTFLLPYSMLARGWDREFRGLAIFDLATGLLIPFMLATTCVVIASSLQFHTQPAEGFLGETDEDGALVAPAGNLVNGYYDLAGKRLKVDMGDEAFEALLNQHDGAKKFNDLPLELRQELAGELPEADRAMAATLVRRDAFNLAAALEPLTGHTVAHVVFGVGVLGMALSTIIMLMLINGFVVCEMFDMPAKGTPHRIGCLIAGCIGASGPFVWGAASFWLAVPTSVFGMVLLPIAYLTFALLMNQKNLLGRYMPTGMRRVRWNVLMATALTLAMVGSLWSLWTGAGWFGIGGLIAFIGLLLFVHFAYPRKAMPLEGQEQEDSAKTIPAGGR